MYGYRDANGRTMVDVRELVDAIIVQLQENVPPDAAIPRDDVVTLLQHYHDQIVKMGDTK